MKLNFSTVQIFFLDTQKISYHANIFLITIPVIFYVLFLFAWCSDYTRHSNATTTIVFSFFLSVVSRFATLQLVLTGVYSIHHNTYVLRS